MVVANHGEGVDIEVGSTIEGGIEHQTDISVPVAIDILRTGGANTSAGVECHLVADGIARGGESHPCGNGALMGLHVVIVEQAEILSERGLQTRVTFLDVQRVAVVGDVEQVGHLRLGGVGVILYAQLAHLGALPAEVEGWREVGHSTGGVGMHALIVLQEV